MTSLLLAWTNCWKITSPYSGDLTSWCSSDVTVMFNSQFPCFSSHSFPKNFNRIKAKFESLSVMHLKYEMAHFFLLNSAYHQSVIFSCDQAALWMVQSVCLSVCLSVYLSVRHTFLTMFPSSYHHEIFRSYYQWQKWRPCKSSRSEVKGQGHRDQHPA